jgi:hypothetical protein
MKWAKKAHESGYCFGSHTQQSLKKQLDSALPSSLHGGNILSKTFDAGRPDEATITLCYFDPVQLIARARRDPFVMKDFICYPQMKITNCGTRIYDEESVILVRFDEGSQVEKLAILASMFPLKTGKQQRHRQQRRDKQGGEGKVHLNCARRATWGARW